MATARTLTRPPCDSQFGAVMVLADAGTAMRALPKAAPRTRIRRFRSITRVPLPPTGVRRGNLTGRHTGSRSRLVSISVESRLVGAATGDHRGNGAHQDF